MLNKNEVLRKLKTLIPDISLRTDEDVTILKDCLKWLIDNTQKLPELFTLSDISWVNNINQECKLGNWLQPYRILGVDGSQIYPDKHLALNCFLLNIGFADFFYSENSKVILKSIPEVYAEISNDCESSTENINYLRTEQELIKGFEYSETIYNKKRSEPLIVLFDGPLYFWYLNNKSEEIKKRFLPKYIASLNSFYSKRIPIIGFLSAPKNKDIIHLLKIGLSREIIDLGYKPNSDLGFSNDVDLISLFLPPYSRTPLFYLSSNLSFYYPEHLRPTFCYINIESEIVRVEFPYWVTQEPYFDTYLSILINQCRKGNGYPIALSEAHEQAVIKTADRDFFFNVFNQIGQKNNYACQLSQKITKKMIVGV